MTIYTYRYMWRTKGSTQINFKIVTDTADGLKIFEENLSKVPDLDLAGKEYLHEINVDLIAKTEVVFKCKDELSE